MATRMVRRALLAAFCFITSLRAGGRGRNPQHDLSRHSWGVDLHDAMAHFGAAAPYPWQIDPRETVASAERERKWLARCRPIAKEDALGVSRYVYAASGCEFGKLQD